MYVTLNKLFNQKTQRTVMLQNTIFSFALFILCIPTITDSTDTSFWLPQNPSLRFHNNDPIKLKPGSYERLVNRWEKRLHKSWNNFYQNLQNDADITAEQLDTLAENETIASIYGSLKEKELLKLDEYIDEENMDQEVLTFIKRVLQKYCSKKNIKIFLTSHINTVTITFGSDKTGHYLVCHANIYSPENVKHFYENLAINNGAFYIEPLKNGKVRFIELSNFLLAGLIEASSHIQHQSNLLTFIVSNFKFTDLKPSDLTIQSCWHITEIRGIIESILQSKNPLETALFIGKSRKRNIKEQELWKKIINEIANCYTPESLELFKLSVQEINNIYNS